MGYTFYDNNNNNNQNGMNRNHFRPSTRGQPSTNQSVCCGFCKKNRETPQVYLSHRTKDDQGRVACPTLRRYRCPNCGATGDEAHTRSNCPNVVSMRQQQQQQQQMASSSQQIQQAAAGMGEADQQANRNRPTNDLEFGINRCLANMSSVTSTRYNAAGRLRNRPNKQYGHPDSTRLHFNANGNPNGSHYGSDPFQNTNNHNGNRFQ